MENLFINALKDLYRYKSNVGWLNTEDLFTLSVESLNSIWQTLNTQLDSLLEDSLISPDSNKIEIIQRKLEIVEFIVEMKIEERKAHENEAAIREQKQQIMELIAKKQNEALESMSVEDLMAKLNELG